MIIIENYTLMSIELQMCTRTDINVCLKFYRLEKCQYLVFSHLIMWWYPEHRDLNTHWNDRVLDSVETPYIISHWETSAMGCVFARLEHEHELTWSHSQIDVSLGSPGADEINRTIWSGDPSSLNVIITTAVNLSAIMYYNMYKLWHAD